MVIYGEFRVQGWVQRAGRARSQILDFLYEHRFGCHLACGDQKLGASQNEDFSSAWAVNVARWFVARVLYNLDAPFKLKTLRTMCHSTYLSRQNCAMCFWSSRPL
jgi:hypothetical protein